MVSERTWHMVFNRAKPAGSVIPRHPDAAPEPDPNNEVDAAAVEYWMQFADYYVFPHVIIFESMQELADKLLTVDFKAVSAAQLQAAAALERNVTAQWARITNGIIPRTARPPLDPQSSYEDRMNAIYGAGNRVDY